MKFHHRVIFGLSVVLAVIAGMVIGAVATGRSIRARMEKEAAPAMSLAAGAEAGVATGIGMEGTDVPVNIAVATVEVDTMQEHLTLPAFVEPWKDVTVACELPGKLVRLEVSEGDPVQQGQLIAQIDTADLEANVALAEATLAMAKSEYDRAVTLSRQGVEAAQTLEKAREAQEVAQARHDAAGVALSRATIKAPLDGVVDEVPVELGEYIDPGQMVARIIQEDRMKITAQLPEQHASYIKLGAPVKISPKLSDREQYDGEVLYLSHTASQSTRTYRLEVAFDNASRLLRAGQIVKIRMVRRTIENAIVVPLRAVVAGKEGRFIFTENDGVAHQKRVTFGAFDRDRVQIVSGLTAGERLIVSGQRLVAAGDRVRVVEEKPLSEAASTDADSEDPE